MAFVSFFGRHSNNLITKIVTLCFVFRNYSASNKTVSQILDKLLMKGHYDLRLRPNYDGKFLIQVTILNSVPSE